MLCISLVLTGLLGILQEQTYKKYGPHWREGVFYTVRACNVINIVTALTRYILALPLSASLCLPHSRY
jgi:hypothetical protein